MHIARARVPITKGRILWTSGLFKTLRGPASIAQLSSESGPKLSIKPAGLPVGAAGTLAVAAKGPSPVGAKACWFESSVASAMEFSLVRFHSVNSDR